MKKQQTLRSFIILHGRYLPIALPEQVPTQKPLFACIETNRGTECGKIIVQYKIPTQKFNKKSDITIKKFLRFATNEDITKLNDLSELASKYTHICQKLADSNEANIYIKKCDILFDEKKVFIFYKLKKTKKKKNVKQPKLFELTRQIKSTLEKKVELTEITDRSCTKMLGGIGTCGRSLCCAQFQKVAKGIPARFAKDQNLNMNPKNLCGICGKLKCCIRYEKDNYQNGKIVD